MDENPLFPLSFIAGPAILTNVCAILQNGATMRYNLAITQWRDFCASLAARDDQLSLRYVDPPAAIALAERRIRLQLRALNLLNAATALFAGTTIFALAGSFLAQLRHLPAGFVGAVTAVTGAAGLLFLLAATVTFFLEGRCGSAMLSLHPQLGGPVGAGQQQREMPQ